MKSENLKTRTANELGALLRHWRDMRGKSQFDLSRHGCFAKADKFCRERTERPQSSDFVNHRSSARRPLARPEHVAARGRLCPDLFRERLGLCGNEKCDRRPEAHSAPAGAVSGNGNGPLLEPAHDE